MATIYTLDMMINIDASRTNMKQEISHVCKQGLKQSLNNSHCSLTVYSPSTRMSLSYGHHFTKVFNFKELCSLLIVEGEEAVCFITARHLLSR